MNKIAFGIAVVVTCSTCAVLLWVGVTTLMGVGL